MEKATLLSKKCFHNRLNNKISQLVLIERTNAISSSLLLLNHFLHSTVCIDKAIKFHVILVFLYLDALYKIASSDIIRLLRLDPTS